ncbi:MAG: hypothetical protein HOK80_02610 [Candidatus Cloacimonetes bacterium]|jgi:hypothetical protein|nr:hypothetical protein [Candidatus Cloacimonadota bacterium]MBT5419755.1 hypothetical protein [Candidatus Cloacimonadota bacterium]
MKTFYFKINLNKFGELKQKAEAEKRTFKISAISYAAIFLIATIIAIIFSSNLSGKIKNRSALLNSIRDEIKTYKVSGEFLSSKDLARLNNISSERIFWTQKLVALSEKTTDKIAITHFSFKSNKLSLFGITRLDRDQKEFDLINDFIVELNNNDQISSDFPKIQFVKSSKDKEKDVDILRFQIDCISKSYTGKGGRK